MDKLPGNKKKILSLFSERDILVFFADICTVENVKQAINQFRIMVKLIKPAMGVFVVVTGLKQLTKLKKDPIFQNYNSSEPFDKYLEGRFSNMCGGLKLFGLANFSKTVTDDILKKVGNHMRAQFKDEVLDIV